ncbi:MAG: hypothetical protein WC865_17770 [Bacteroidales bacterium]
MKKLGYFLSISALAIFALVVLFPACEGTEGPAGKDGLDGKDGKDVNAFCVKCHNQATFSAVEAQFETSLHNEGHTWTATNYGGRNPCAMCHSYQGYVETKLTGRDSMSAPARIPVALQCDACHDFHGTLDSTDFPNYALGHTEPVSLIFDNHKSTIDFGNSSNACTYCHQARSSSEFPLPLTGDTTYAITNSRFGPHYGVQGNLLNGSQGWEYAGSMAYTNTNHKGVATCAMCHMAKGEGTEVGGHTWRIKNEDGSKVNLTGCKKCHTDATSTDVNGKQTEIAGLLGQLKTKLIEKKLLNADTGLAWPYNNASGKGARWTLKEAGAFFNYKMVKEDRSSGVHNYKYVKALLVNSLGALN